MCQQWEGTVEDSNDLNDQFNAGKDDIRQAVRAYLRHSMTQGDEVEKRISMTVSSLLSLSIRKSPPQIDVSYIRALIIDENVHVLAGMENDTGIIRLFAVATGRVTEIREHLAALGRVGQTYLNEGEALAGYLVAMKGWLGRMERASVRISRGAGGTPILLEPVDSAILPPASRILEEELV